MYRASWPLSPETCPLFPIFAAIATLLLLRPDNRKWCYIKVQL